MSVNSFFSMMVMEAIWLFENVQYTEIREWFIHECELFFFYDGNGSNLVV